MATNENLIPIPGRLHSVATEGHVAGADEIFDDSLQKTQAVINAEIDEVIDDVALIDTTESSPAVVPSFDPTTDTVHVTAQTLSESQKAQVRNNIGLGDVDAKINEAVASEASQRAAADSSLQSSISAEATARANADSALSSNVNSRLDSQDAAIALLNGSEVIVVTDHTTVASPDSQKIYREQGSTTYTDWMYQGGAWKEIATYSFPGIDEVLKADSHNLVENNAIVSSLCKENRDVISINSTITGYFIKGNFYGSGSAGVKAANADSKIMVYSLTSGRYYLTGRLPLGNGVSAVALYQDAECTQLINVVTDSTGSQDYGLYIDITTSCYLGATSTANANLSTVYKSTVLPLIENFTDVQQKFLYTKEITGWTELKCSLNKGDAIYFESVGSAEMTDIFLRPTYQSSTGQIQAQKIESGDGFYIVAPIDIESLVIWIEVAGSFIVKNWKTSDEKKPLEGYELFSIGDSLSVSGAWQSKVSDITGCTFDNNKNNLAGKEISMGGMSSYGVGFYNAMWRTRNLILQNTISNDGEKAIIIFENGNDAGNTVTYIGNERVFVPTEPIDAGLVADFSSQVLLNIPAASRSLNSVLKLGNVVQGTNLKVINLPIREGDVRITIRMDNVGTRFYNIHLVPQSTEALTLQYVLDRILEYDYAGCNDTLAADGESVDFSEAGQGAFRPEITFSDFGNTGMSVSITDTDNARTSIAYYFIGSSTGDSDWGNTDNWQVGISFGSGLKSSIELLKRTYPKAHIFMSDFPVHMDTPSNYLNSRGVYDEYAYVNSALQLRDKNLFEQYEKVANFYNIPILRCSQECGISISNYSTYYYDNNTHPKPIGYEKIGEVIAAQVLKYF